MPDRNRCLPVLLALVMSLALCLPGAASGTPTEFDLKNAEALATEAKVYFRTKQFDKAADKFMQAFGVSKKPALLYNAARAYEEAGKLQQAVAMFTHYRSLAAADVAGKGAAARKIESLSAQIKRAKEAEKKRMASAQKEREREIKVVAPPRATASSAASAPSSSAAKRPALVTATKDERRRPTSAKTTVAGKAFPLWRAVGAGSSLLFAGASYANAYRIATAVAPSEVIDEASKSRYQSNAQSAQTWRIVAVAGAVAGVGLAAWAGWAWVTNAESNERTVAISPMLGQPGITVGRHF